MRAEGVLGQEAAADETVPGARTALLRRLRAHFGDRVVFDRTAPIPPAARLAVTLDADARGEFTRWARSHRLRSLTVELDVGTALVGPLAVPGRPNGPCCARARRLAAAAGDRGAGASPGRVSRADESADRAFLPPGPIRSAGPVGRAGIAPSLRQDGGSSSDRTVAVPPVAVPGRAAVSGAFLGRTARTVGPVDRAAAESPGAVPGPTGRTRTARPDDPADRTAPVSPEVLSGLPGRSTVSGVVLGGTARPDDAADRTAPVSPEVVSGLSGGTAVSGAFLDGTARPGDPADRTAPVPPTVADGVVRLVAALLDQDATDLVDHLAELVDGADPLWHKVIPLPACGVCGGADGIGTVGLPPGDDPDALLEALAGWVDPLTGVIPWLSLRRPLGPGPGMPFVATAAPPHLLDADGTPRAMPAGWGKGVTRRAALVSAVGEAVERYSASLPDPDRLVWARPADLDGEVLDPREFPLYEPEQYATPGFAQVPFDRRVDHPWVRGSWLTSGTPVWVPAVFAYLSLTVLPEHLICQGTSNGLAAGTDAESAALRATLELVERDAMMATWLTGARGRFVELDDTLDPDLRGALDSLQAMGPSVEVYVLPTSTYGTTAVALAIGDGRRWPGVSLGLGTDRGPRTAIRQAILELAQTAPHLARLLRDGHHPVPGRPKAVRDLLDHAAYYFPVERIAAFDRLRCGGTTTLEALPEPSFPTTRDDLATTLANKDIRVALVDVTSADVATGPFRVVRAVSPDLQPISYGHGNDRSLVARLRHSRVPLPRRLIHPVW